MIAAIERSRKKCSETTLPTRFTPKFWTDADRRVALVREIESRVERMKSDAGADSFQKETLAERAVFLIAMLETAERDAIENVKPLDTGQYVQAVNSLIGVLKALGLEKHAKRLGLAAYVEAKQA